MEKPAPISDATSSFYWEGAGKQRLLVQCCGACGRFQYPPDVVCPSCQSDDLQARQVSGRGTLYSMTVLRQAFHPAFADSVPYIIGLVALEDVPGVRLLTNIVDADVADLERPTRRRRRCRVFGGFSPTRLGHASAGR